MEEIILTTYHTLIINIIQEVYFINYVVILERIYC